MSKLQAQILGNRFAALAREGAERFAAMSRSPLVIEEGQYACAILDADGRLIAQDQGEPSQLAAVQATVAYTLDAFAFNLSEGDVILTGDPYCGGTWGGVLTVIVPIFSDGDLRFISAIRFAAADLAGNIPGPFQPDAHEIWQESLRLSPVKLFKAGAPQKDIRQYVIRNTRATALLDSDITTATVTAKRLSAHIEEMIDQKGLDLVQSAAEERIAYGLARAKSALQDIPEGKAKVDGIELSIRQENVLVVDLTGTHKTQDDATNISLQSTQAVVLTQLASEVIEDAGLSQGILDAIKIHVPKDSLLNPSFPAALSLGWRITAPMLSLALAQATNGQPKIYGAPPLVMLFDEIGAGAVTQPIALSPGFTSCAGYAGSDAASGKRRIISAEETETTGAVFLEQRQLSDTGIEAHVRIMRDGLEGIVVPGASTPQMDGAEGRPRSNVLSLPSGTSIRFSYPTTGEGSDAEL